MSLPHWAPPRKPRRLGLWAPFILTFVAFLILSGVWFWMRGEVTRRMDDARTAAVDAGWTLAWGHRSISGFPFRLDVKLETVRAREPSGWGVAAPRLSAEAFVFAPTHWVAVAPDGVTIVRRKGGPLVVTAKALRASVSEASATPPRISVEGLGLTFSTPPGAAPFLLRGATEFHLHTKAGPDNQGAVYIEVDGATTRLTGLLARIADGSPSSLVLDAIFSNAAALRGHYWTAAERSWAASGGQLNLRRLRITAGQADIDARAGVLGVGGDGRLRGHIDLVLRQAPRTLGAMGAEGTLAPETARAAATLAGAVQQGPLASLPLSFQAGRTTLGPLAVGPAPRIY